MRRSSAAVCLALALVACGRGNEEADSGVAGPADGNEVTGAGRPSGGAGGCQPVSSGSCPGQVAVSQGLLAGGTAGDALAASAFFSFGARVVMSGTTCVGVPPAETTSHDAKASTIRLNLAEGLGPGTYEVLPDGGSQFSASYTFTSPYYGGFVSAPISGTLTLTRVDPTTGVEGCYHLDFGGNGISGGGCSPSGCVSGSLGELIEEGTFVAPVCDICGTEP